MSHLVIHVSSYIQVPLTADHGLIEATQHLQRVAEVSAGFGLSNQVADCPEQKHITLLITFYCNQQSCVVRPTSSR